MRFVDEVNIIVKGGRGGDGFVGWRREKYVPMGGPEGGDGGNGGAVILIADPGLNTLIDFSFNPHLTAGDGDAGGINQLTGGNGVSLERRVPVGTQVFYGERLVADLSQPHARWVAARGGHGGKGNAHFKSATNQAPDYAQKGQPGEERTFRLILKSVADVGLIGFPSVGKSTLISKISRTHPKIADYPFTTLVPNLGVVMLDRERRFVVADIPGLIIGAHEGRGLGHTFLRHVERTKVLAQLIDIGIDSDGHRIEIDESISEDELSRLAQEQFLVLDHELRAFSPALADKPRIIIFSKADIAVQERAYAASRQWFAEHGYEPLLVSNLTGLGITQLLEQLWGLVDSAQPLTETDD